MKAVVDNKIPFIQGQIEQLVDEVRYLPGAEIAASDVADADILIVRTRTRCNRQLLEGSSVRLVVTATIGYDHIDTDFLAEKHIRWTNCPGCNAGSVRQYVHNALLATEPLFGLLPHADFAPTAAVVGVGHVGSLVADDLRRMGFRVLLNDPKLPHAASLEQIAREADLITFHPNLTTAPPHPSFHLADEAFFAQLKRWPLIINSSRGEVVSNPALLAALESGQVRGAVVDTWENEPNIDRQLLQRAAIATPHIAGYSADGKANATRMSLQAVCQFLGCPFSLTITPPPLPEGFAYGPETAGPLRLYDPRVDSDRLKAHPEQFEQLRGNYPLRREIDEAEKG